MATPADQRLLDLLEKWLKSLELHARYAALDPESYAKVQPWPDHERPSRWIIDLATQKATALLARLKERMAEGDATFSDSLELMAFLAHLLGSEHIERFIPLADPQGPAPGTSPDDAAPRAAAPRPAARRTPAPPPTAASAGGTEHRDSSSKTAARPPAKTTTASQRAAASAPPQAAPPSASRAQAVPPATVSAGFPEAVVEQVIADATRLVQWGRKWYELAELISSMADRPPLTDVRLILKDNKTVIDIKAGRG